MLSTSKVRFISSFFSPNRMFLLDEYIYMSVFNFNNKLCWDFPGGTVVENPPASSGDTGSIPDPGRSYMLWSN